MVVLMKFIVPAAVLLFAGAAYAQTPPAQAPASQVAPIPPVSTLTRDLNSGPPAPAVYLAPAPAPAPGSAPTTVPTPAPSTGTPAPTSPRPATTHAPAAVLPAPIYPTPVPTRVPPPPSAQPSAPVVATPIPIEAAPRPRVTPAPAPALVSTPTPPVAARPAVAPPVVAAPVPAPASAAPAPVGTPVPTPAPAAPALTVLDSAARAALPFTAELPAGFEIVSGRPGPDFRIYTIRRGGQSFVMVYTGPASQFPIYSGQMVEAGGRASILSTEDGVRRAVEHLFQRSSTPSEIHVWTMSLDGADRNLAEQIAQSVDVR